MWGGRGLRGRQGRGNRGRGAILAMCQLTGSDTGGFDFRTLYSFFVTLEFKHRSNTSTSSGGTSLPYGVSQCSSAWAFFQ